MVHTNYAFYTAEFDGDLIPERDFPKFEDKAVRYIHSLCSDDMESDDFKAAVCAVAEVYFKDLNGGELQSQTVGKWSKTYVTSGKSLEEKLYSAAKLYLGEKIKRIRWV